MERMKVTLTQQRIYKSITKLTQTEIPAFTVLTGVNGSGKSHLLEAIRDGHIRADIAPNPSDIRLFNWNDLVPNDVGITNISQVHSHRDWFINSVRNQRSQHTHSLFDTLRRHSVDQHFSADPWQALTKSNDQLIAIGANADTINNLRTELNNFEKQIRNETQRQFGQDEIKKGIFSELIQGESYIHSLSPSFFDRRAFAFYGNNMFQHSFGEMFFAYFDKLRANRNRRLDELEGRTPSVPSLSETEFIAKHGTPPWDFVNDTLKQARLDFRIDFPTDYEATEFWPRLTKTSTDQKIDFNSLSSGEKILMSFAFCLYNTTDKRQRVTRPKLLLFDEIDAPLHPSMSRVLVDIVDSILVKQEGIAAILVTHSPSTVAVSPDESIHLLEPLTNKISAESKRRAVSTLTADIPTMSIDFSGRRQVFVESDFDAARYQLLYQLMAPVIESERSLSFIGVGHANMGTGCDQVVSTVTSLTEGGNSSVLGLIDWDTKNAGTNRVFVLGHGERYAIENYLLDPALLAAAILNDDPSHAEAIGLDSSATFAGFSTLDSASIQRSVAAIQGRIISRLGHGSETGSIEVRYGSGRHLTMDRRYLMANGHDLEAAVVAEFPKLRRHNGTGKLLYHMVDVVIRNHVSLVPEPLVGAMRWLCNTNFE
ncbi:MAG: ATP-binding protein [Mesorhizobium sp.]|uniref:ATP-binding protein n=1 Tax=Mesorhizobium sp. TaxID=1871066 RepID=UPI001202760F|nr:ATP-binding protein [Mesorhizobium sp.]TIO19912.1 MAG: ATP-binding protein [Mesorhizobium sp.]